MGTVIHQSSWYAKGNKKMMRHGPENIFTTIRMTHQCGYSF